MIPMCDLKQQYLQLKDELDAAILEVAADGQYILGPNVKAFEQEIAAYCGCQYAIGVGSGTDALHLTLRALGIGPGDEVITTPFTFIATTEAILMVGAKPVFVDIDSHTFNISPQLLETAVTPRTKAILAVHLYGQPCDMAPLFEIAKPRGIQIVEDCAQALGAKYLGQKVGTLGVAGCLSFFPSKNLGCFGDGGMVVTNDPQLSESVDILRRHGGKVKYHHDHLGLNSRLDEMQAAILRVKLKYLDAWNTHRRNAAYRYNKLLATATNVQTPRELDTGGFISPQGTTVPQNTLLSSVYHQYTLQVKDRTNVSNTLKQAGIQSLPYYPVPLHLQRVHAALKHKPGDFPVAEQVANHCLSLPMFPELSEDQQVRITSQIRKAVTVGDNHLVGTVA